MPDDVAVAEPEAPSPPVEPESVLEEQEPLEEPVAVEGEASEEESGAQPDEEAGSVDDRIADAMREIAKDNPEAYLKALDALPEEQRAKFQDADALLAQQTSAQRQQAVQGLQSDYFSTVGRGPNVQSAQAYVTSVEQGLRKGINDALAKAREGESVDVDSIIPAHLKQTYQASVQHSQTALQKQEAYLNGSYYAQGMDRIESHPAYKYLNAEQRQALGQGDIWDAWATLAEAALGSSEKAADDKVETRTKAQLEKLGVLEKLEKIAGTNGRKATQGQKTNPPTSQQARLDRLALGRDEDGNPPTEEDKAWLAARN